VLANGFFVASEFALVAVRRTRIDQLAAEGVTSALVVKRAITHVDRFISATQVGVTVASLLLGARGEHAFSLVFSPMFQWVPAGLPADITGGLIAVCVSYFVMTSLHVIIGELVPKSIALQYTERTALVIGRPITLFARLVSPFTWFLHGVSRLLLRALGVTVVEGRNSVHSAQELDLLVSQSHQGGELNDTEAEILHRVVRFSDLTLREIMVPRVEMEALPVEMPRLAVRAWVHSRPHSRVPVFIGSFDEVIGVVHLKDMVPFVARLPVGADEETVSIMPLVREALRLPETSTVDKLLIQFKRSRQQMAIVIDEFGGTSGLVTLGDLLEQVFGEVADEFDLPSEAISIGEKSVSLPGRTLISEVNDRFGTNFPADEVDTVAGLVLAELGRPAKPGDTVEIGGSRLTVEQIDRLRVLRVALELDGGPPGAGAETG